jgi:hypothetical protein
MAVMSHLSEIDLLGSTRSIEDIQDSKKLA